MSNRLYKRFELRANKAVDNSKKGVVGKIGKKIPKTPKVKLMTPNKISKYFIFIVVDIDMKIFAKVQFSINKNEISFVFVIQYKHKTSVFPYFIQRTAQRLN
ncbi:MAG: hypothetical protein LBS69_02880 [Prevotellaceae bacterium]|nr:hypothetical protein [Prevotellaceae bacterium]